MKELRRFLSLLNPGARASSLVINSSPEEDLAVEEPVEKSGAVAKRESIIGRNADALLILEGVANQRTTVEAEITDGERVLFLGEDPREIKVISLCKFRDVRRINTDSIAVNSSPTEKLVMRIEEESGSDFRLSDSPDDVYRESFYEAVAQFSDGSRDSRDVPQGGSPSVLVLGDTLIPSHGIHERDWKDISHVLDIIKTNEEKTEDFLGQDSVRELLRRMALIAEKGPDTTQSIPNTTRVEIRFG